MEKANRSKKSGVWAIVIGVGVGAGLALVAVVILLGIFNPSRHETSASGNIQVSDANGSTAATQPGKGTLGGQLANSEGDETGSSEIEADNYTDPMISLSANWIGEAQVYKGWPIVLNARLLHSALMVSEDGLAPIVLDLADEGASWTQAVRIEVTDAKGDTQSWPVVLATQPEDILKLDGETAGDLIWTVSSEETASLAEGQYQLAAVLDTTSTGADGSWKGMVKSPAVTVTIAEAPDTLTEEQETEKYLLLASNAMIQDDPDEAWKQIDSLLAAQPENLGGLSFKGDLLAMAGKDSEALATYDYAIDLFYRDNPDSQEPPLNLIRKQGDMLNKLIQVVEDPE